jgi:cation transport regulator ChaC
VIEAPFSIDDGHVNGRRLAIEMKYEEYSQAESEQWQESMGDGNIGGERQAGEEEVVPGVPIIRSSTPRPRSFGGKPPASRLFVPMQQGEGFVSSEFPAQAPSAPPLPEELSEQDEEENDGNPVARERSAQASATEPASEFLWLFEYGLEMDSAIINSPERLNGLALFYGPARLPGYRVVMGAQAIHGNMGSTIVAIVPSAEPGAEVWGVLYRIPRRVAEQSGSEPSLLDTIHVAITPQKFFQGVQVVVQESYRNRAITSVAYVATESARQRLQLVAVEQWDGDRTFIQRLAAIARKQKLPERYIRQYERAMAQAEPEVRMRMPMEAGEQRDDSETEPRVQVVLPRSDMDSGIDEVTDVEGGEENERERMVQERNDELNTEPIRAFGESFFPHEVDLTPTPLPPTPVVAPGKSRWLIAFSLYLVSLLLVSLVFAVLQGLGFAQGALTSQFMPLAVPWLVMMYGLLGGCISSIITLGRFRANCPPPYIIITWFTRPFIGAVLAVLSYLLLTSGLFAFGPTANGHMALFLLAGALAGLGERWVFFKRRA